MMDSCIAYVRRFTQRYPKEAYVFIVASLVNATGSAFLWPLTAIYVHTVLHHSYGDAGLVMLLQAMAGVLGQWFGGALYYRVGVKMLLIGSLFLTALAQLAVAFVADWNLYVSLMCVMGFLMAITMPVINALIGFRWPNHRAELFNVVYVSNNLGMAVGTTLGGLCAAWSFAFAFSVNSVSSLLFGFFFLYFLRGVSNEVTDGLQVHPQSNAPSSGAWGLLRHYRVYLFLGMGSMLTWFSTSVYGSGIAPYLTDKGFSPERYSFLWTVNGIVILFGQPVLSVVNRLISKSLTQRLMVSAVFYLFGFGYISVFHTRYSDLLLGMVVTTFGEMLIAPSVPALVTETTGQSAPFYLGIVGAFSSVGRMLGPFVFGNLYDQAGLSPVFIVCVVSLVSAFATFLTHHRLTVANNVRRILDTPQEIVSR